MTRGKVKTAAERSPIDRPGRLVDEGEVALWRRRVRRAVGLGGTPCLVFAAEPMAASAEALDRTFDGLPVRHWWSFKTLPLAPAVRWWHGRGGGVEVVSEFEWRAAREAGVPVEDVLVNGPAKHSWLPGCAVPGMRVNLDSVSETKALAPAARRWGWQVGLRVSTRREENFEFPGVRTQFGLLGDEVGEALKVLRRYGVVPEVLHFHLRTNVPEPGWYREAAEEALGLAAGFGWQPAFLDLGGGFPPPRVQGRNGANLDAGFSLASMRAVVAGIRSRHRTLRGIWMENGRWLTAAGGVLAVRVLDAKEGRGVRTLMADGGRTLQAMVATWERHAVEPLASRRAPTVRTLVCGPTCMAFDNLGIHDLPVSVAAGDVLIWFDAGAYQLSWETRFSHGLGAVVWSEGDRCELVRPRETWETRWTP